VKKVEREFVATFSKLKKLLGGNDTAVDLAGRGNTLNKGEKSLFRDSTMQKGIPSPRREGGYRP